MNAKAKLFFSFVFVASLALHGCGFSITQSIDTGDSGKFEDVEAGKPNERTIIINNEIPRIKAGQGSLAIPIDGITVDRTEEKARSLFPARSSLAISTNCKSLCKSALDEGLVLQADCDTICTQGLLSTTGWLGPKSDNACSKQSKQASDEYRYEFTLDENAVVTSVSPPSLKLTEKSIALINSGSYGICLRVLSPIDAEITIKKLSITAGL